MHDEEEDAAEIQDALDGFALEAVRLAQRRKLILWGIRTAIGAVLFVWLARTQTWGKWVLYAWIPLSLLSLAAIVFLPAAFTRKRHLEAVKRRAE